MEEVEEEEEIRRRRKRRRSLRKNRSGGRGRKVKEETVHLRNVSEMCYYRSPCDVYNEFKH